MGGICSEKKAKVCVSNKGAERAHTHIKESVKREWDSQSNESKGRMFKQKKNEREKNNIILKINVVAV